MKKHEIYSFPLKGKAKKLFLVMRLTILMVLVGFGQVWAIEGYPDEKNQNATLVGDNMAPDQQTITGKITDAKGEAIPGATVVEKGTSNGVVTDIDGNY